MKYMNNTRGDRQFQCEKCFTQKSYFTKHMKIHKVEKHYCQECRKRFSHTSDLNKHIRKHTGENLIVSMSVEEDFPLQAA